MIWNILTAAAIIAAYLAGSRSGYRAGTLAGYNEACCDIAEQETADGAQYVGEITMPRSVHQARINNAENN